MSFQNGTKKEQICTWIKLRKKTNIWDTHGSKLYEDIGFRKGLRLGLGFRVDKKVRLVGTGEKKCTWIHLKGRGGGEEKQNKTKPKWNIHGQLCKGLGFKKGLALRLGLIRKLAF